MTMTARRPPSSGRERPLAAYGVEMKFLRRLTKHSGRCGAKQTPLLEQLTTPLERHDSKGELLMQELKTPDGKRYWEATDPNDRVILKMAEGSKMRKTTLPSGWTSPDTEQVVRDGALYET